MLQRTSARCYKMPRNLGVAPRYDTWNEKYEPWQHLRRMAKLTGTGFYIPPEWYNHFRMFPPIQHNFTEEKTQNPFNESEPTQTDFGGLAKQDAERKQLRDELTARSRSVASEGKRYLNLFWAQKPIDTMERRYYNMRRNLGASHDDAIKKVLREYFEEQALAKRAAMVQAEEAHMSGKYITMREAATVLNVLVQLPSAQLAPHQYAELAEQASNDIVYGDPREAEVEPLPQKPSVTAAAPNEGDAQEAKAAGDEKKKEGDGAAKEGDAAKTPAASKEEQATTQKQQQEGEERPAAAAAAVSEHPLLSDVLAQMGDGGASSSKSDMEVEKGYQVVARSKTQDTIPKLQEDAMGNVGRSDWFNKQPGSKTKQSSSSSSTRQKEEADESPDYFFS